MSTIDDVTRAAALAAAALAYATAAALRAVAQAQEQYGRDCDAIVKACEVAAVEADDAPPTP